MEIIIPAIVDCPLLRFFKPFFESFLGSIFTKLISDFACEKIDIIEFPSYKISKNVLKLQLYKISQKIISKYYITKDKKNKHSPINKYLQHY